MRKTQLIIGAAGILLSILAFFLPFYETVLMIDKRKITGLMYTYGEVEIGTVAVISGFGSLFAKINILFCAVLAVLLLIGKPNLAITIVIGGLFIGCQVLVLIGCSAGFGKPIGDRMLSGWLLMSLTEIALIVFSVYLAVKRKERAIRTAADF